MELRRYCLLRKQDINNKMDKPDVFCWVLSVIFGGRQCFNRCQCFEQSEMMNPHFIYHHINYIFHRVFFLRLSLVITSHKQTIYTDDALSYPVNKPKIAHDMHICHLFSDI